MYTMLLLDYFVYAMPYLSIIYLFIYFDSFGNLTDYVVVACLVLCAVRCIWTNKHFDFDLTLKWRCSRGLGNIDFGPAPSTGTLFQHWLAPSCYATHYVWTCRGMYQKRVALVLQTMSQNVLMQPHEDKIHKHSFKCTWFMFVLCFFEGLYIYIYIYIYICVCLWDSENVRKEGWGDVREWHIA